MSALHRTLTSAVALCAGLLLAAGCSDDSEGTEPLPPVESSTSTSPSEPSTSPSTSAPTEPAWQDDYSPKELAAYEEALDRFTTYEQRSEPIWRRGKATPAAEQLFQEYFYTWQSQFRRLQTYEQVDVQIQGIPTVLDSQATRIAGGGGSVTIRQCVDFTTSVLMQNGEPAPGASKKPALRTIVLSRSAGAEPSPFKITTVQATEKGCST